MKPQAVTVPNRPRYGSATWLCCRSGVLERWLQRPDAACTGFALLNAAIVAGEVGAVLLQDYSYIAQDYAQRCEWLGRMDKRGVVVCLEPAKREETPKHRKKKQLRRTIRTPPRGMAR